MTSIVLINKKQIPSGPNKPPPNRVTDQEKAMLVMLQAIPPLRKFIEELQSKRSAYIDNIIAKIKAFLTAIKERNANEKFFANNDKPKKKSDNTQPAAVAVKTTNSNKEKIYIFELLGDAVQQARTLQNIKDIYKKLTGTTAIEEIDPEGTSITLRFNFISGSEIENQFFSHLRLLIGDKINAASPEGKEILNQTTTRTAGNPYSFNLFAILMRPVLIPFPQQIMSDQDKKEEATNGCATKLRPNPFQTTRCC